MFENNPQSAQFPGTAAYIQRHSRCRPDHVAVLNNETRISYAEFNRDLSRITHAIAGFGLARGDIAAIGHADFYVQLLLVLGCESLGIVTGSFRPGEGADCQGLLAGADLVLTENPAFQPFCRRLFHVTADWIANSLQNPAPVSLLAPAAAAAGENRVILRSSGTTGTPKRMMLTHRMMRERLKRQRDPVSGLGLDANARFYAAMHVGVGSIYMAAVNCFCLGATFMSAANLRGLADLAAYRPTHITMLPFHLRRLLEQMPPPTAPGPLLPGLTVQTIGARLPRDLRRLALQKFCGAIRENYGTNEAGAIGTVDETGLITLTPGIAAEVAAGELRLRGAGVATGYMDDPATTGTMFRAGWFYPGDLASLSAPHQLRLLGRRSDVLNLGGLKFACADLEEKILALPGVSDTALAQPGNAIEPTRVMVFIVPTPKFDLRACITNLKRIIDFPFQVQTCGAIPRNPAGKILRTALQETARAA
jgi:acyl-coenzyme A synthetase/AMP-(fatty) acid ligase